MSLHVSSDDLSVIHLHDSVNKDWIAQGNILIREALQNRISASREVESSFAGQNLTADQEAHLQDVHVNLINDQFRLAKISGSNADKSMFIFNNEVHLLASNWLADELAVQQIHPCNANEHNDFISGISSFDLTLREVVRDIDEFDQTGNFPRPHNPRQSALRLRVCNTCTAEHSGKHWFTLAYTIEHQARACNE